MRILVLLLLLIVVACAPATRTTVFQSYSPKPQDYPIKIYRHKMPTCEFEELGVAEPKSCITSSLISFSI